MDNEFIYNNSDSFTTLDSVLKDVQKKRVHKKRRALLIFLCSIYIALAGAVIIVSVLRYGLHIKEETAISGLLLNNVIYQYYFDIPLMIKKLVMFWPVVFRLCFNVSIIIGCFFVVSLWPFLIQFYVIRKLFLRQMTACLLCNCFQSKVSIPNVLKAFAVTQFRWTRAKLQKAASLLESGVSLQKTVALYPHLLPESVTQLIMLHGDRPEVMKLIKKDNECNKNSITGNISSSSRFLYLFLCFGTIMELVFFNIIFILPKYGEIFADYDVELPFITTFFFYISEMIMIFIIPIEIILFPIFIISLIYAVLIWWGIVPWRPWLIRRLFHDKDSAMLLRFLGSVIEMGISIPEALSVYGKSLRSHFRYKRCCQMQKTIEEGLSWIDTLCRFHFITKKEAVLLESAQRAGNTDAVLYDLAESKEARQIRNSDLNCKILFILLSMTFGLYVFFVLCACFVPIIVLTKSLGV